MSNYQVLLGRCNLYMNNHISFLDVYNIENIEDQHTKNMYQLVIPITHYHMDYMYLFLNKLVFVVHHHIHHHRHLVHSVLNMLVDVYNDTYTQCQSQFSTHNEQYASVHV